MRTRDFVRAAAMVALAASIAAAADQTILGKKLIVKVTTPVDRRKLTMVALERNTPNTLLGDPTVGGATVELRLNGGTPTSQTIALPGGTFWKVVNGGFKYKDAHGANGPVKSLRVKRTPSSKFIMKLIVLGKNGPMFVFPPNPGSSGCVAISLGGGDRYSVQFGSESLLTNNGDKLFRAKIPIFEAVCPIGSTTTSTSTSSTSSTTSTTVGSASPSFVFLETAGLF